MQPDNDQPTDRRRFLKKAAAASAAVGATVGAGALLPETAAADEAEPGNGEPHRDGYRVTSHVLDYYRSAKL
jgi:hypothetical protein